MNHSVSVSWRPCCACLNPAAGNPRRYPQVGITTHVDGATRHLCVNHAGSAAFLAAAAANPPPRLSAEAMAVVLVANPTGRDGRTARERAVVLIDDGQTSAEREARSTTDLNGIGWRAVGTDAQFGGDLAAKVRRGWRFTPAQNAAALNLLLKYSGQLARIAAARAVAQEVAAEVAHVTARHAHLGRGAVVPPPPAPVPALPAPVVVAATVEPPALPEPAPAAPAAKRAAGRKAAATKPAAKMRAANKRGA